MERLLNAKETANGRVQSLVIIYEKYEETR
jgi:hypothetical protein